MLNEAFLVSTGAVAYVTAALCYSSVFAFIRKRMSIFDCPFCVSFWLSLCFTIYVSPGTWLSVVVFSFGMAALASCIVGIIHITIFKPSEQIAHLKKLLKDANEALNRKT